MRKVKYKNFPLQECDTALQRIMRDLPEGSAFFQKWTCGGCGARVTGNTPNKLFIGGHCEDCGHITDIRKSGCNYSLHMAIGGLASAEGKGNA
jgi:hypothetical protein